MATGSTLRIAWRNLGRNRKRTFLALMAIAVGQLAFLAVSALINGYGLQYFKSITGPMVGHIQIHELGWRDDRSIDMALPDLENIMTTLRSDPDVAHAAPRLYTPVLAALTDEGFMGMAIGVDPAVEIHDSGLLAGMNLVDRIGQRRILVGSIFARKHDIEPGMELAVIGQDVDGSIANDLFTVSDIITSPVEVVNSLGIVMAIEDAQEFMLLQNQAHEIVIHINEADRVDEIVSRLASLPVLKDKEVLPWQEIVPQLVTIIETVSSFTLIILVIVFIAAAAGITNTMLMSTYERIHEFGMLISLGCGPGRLARIVAIEAVFLGVLGVTVGSVLGLIFVLITSTTGLDYAALGGSDTSFEVAFQGLQVSSYVIPQIGAGDVLAGFIAVIVTSFISALWPMLHIMRLEPMEAIRS